MEVFAELKAIISDFSEKMAEARGEMEETEHSGGSSFSSLGSKAGLGLAAVGVAGVAVAGVMLDLGLKFQTSTAQMAAAGDIPIKTATAIGNAFLHTGDTTVFSGLQMEQAYGSVAGRLALLQGSTLNAAQATAFMNTSMDLAEESGSSLSSTTDSLSAVMLAFGMNTSQASDAATILYNTGAKTGNSVASIATTVDKLHMKLGDLTPSLAQTGGLLVTLAENGVSGTRGMNTMSTSLTKLLGNTKPVDAELKTLGVSLYNSQGQFVGLGPVMDALGQKLVNMTQQQQIAATTTLFGANAASVMGNILSYGSQQLDQNTKAVQNTAAAHAALAAQQHTVEHETEALKVQLENTATVIGLKMIPIVEKVLAVFSKFIEYVMTHKTVLDALIVTVGVLLVAAAVAWVASLSPIILTVGAIVLAVGAMITIGTLLYDNWNKVLTFLRSDFGTLAQIILLGPLAIITLLALHWQAVWSGMQTAVRDFVGFFTAIPGELWNDVMLPILTWFSRMPGEILGYFTHLGSDLVNTITRNIPGAGIVGSAFKAIGLAAGGLVTSPTLAIVGEAGPELVIPMSDLQGAALDGAGVNRGVGVGSAGGGGGGTGDLVIQVDGQTFARVAGPAFRNWLITQPGRSAARIL